MKKCGSGFVGTWIPAEFLKRKNNENKLLHHWRHWQIAKNNLHLPVLWRRYAYNAYYPSWHDIKTPQCGAVECSNYVSSEDCSQHLLNNKTVGQDTRGY